MSRPLSRESDEPAERAAPSASPVAPPRNSLDATVADSTANAEAAVAALYRERGAEFLRYALATSRDQELAKDALQEALLRYFVALLRGETIETPRAWVYEVLRNYISDFQRQLRRHGAQSVIVDTAGYSQDIEGKCLRNQILGLARSTLTSREFDCIKLRAEGMRYEEIATSLQLTTGTVGTFVNRAMRKIRAVLAPAGGTAHA